MTKLQNSDYIIFKEFEKIISHNYPSKNSFLLTAIKLLAPTVVAWITYGLVIDIWRMLTCPC